MSLIELAEGVEKATGPDAELGRKVLLACGWRKSLRGYFLGPLETWTHPNGKPHFGDDDFRRYDPTASIDAAMSLAGEGFQRVSRPIDGETEGGFVGAISYVDEWGDPCIAFGRGATPALALCAAALRARAQQEQGAQS